MPMNTAVKSDKGNPMSTLAKTPATPATAEEAGEWYLLQTHPRQEARAQTHLNNQGFEVFFPQVAEAQLKQGKESQRLVPLFPNYLFVRLRAGVDNWSPIRSTRGVLRLVAFGGRPRPVEEHIITAIQQRLAQAAPPKALTKGDKLLLQTGEGASAIEAIFQRYAGEERVIVLLNLLQRQQEVSVKLSQVKKQETP